MQFVSMCKRGLLLACFGWLFLGCEGGEALAPSGVFVVSPEVVTFQSVEPGDSAYRWVRIWNPTDAPLILGAVRVAAGEAFSAGTDAPADTLTVPVCREGQEVAARASCRWYVKFQPPAVGQFTGEVEVPGPEGVAMGRLQGRGQSFCTSRRGGSR